MSDWRAGWLYETQRAMSPEELQRSMLAGAAAQQNVFARHAFTNLLNAFEYTYTKCARCGDERMALESVVDQEIAHALAGCNGPLYQFDPTQKSTPGTK